MTPQAEDIRNKSFRSGLSGYKPAEVHAFLNEVAILFDQLQSENAKLNERCIELSDKIKHTEELDARLHGMLDSMHDSTEKLTKHAELNISAKLHHAELERTTVLQNAQAEAAVIIRDAQVKAERMITEAEKIVGRLKDEITLLRTSRHALTSRIKAVLQSQIDFLESLKTDATDPLLPHELLPYPDLSQEGVGARELSLILQRLDKIGEQE
jgi:cell division initiation protein